MWAHTKYVACGFVFLILSLGAIGAPGPAETPAVDEILKRVIEHARLTTSRNLETHFTWTEHVVTEEIDDDAGVKSKEEKVYEAFPIGGSTYSRLVQLNGKPLTEKEQKKEREREQKFRQELESKRGDPAEGDSVELNEELMRRFRFVLGEEEAMGGRTSYVLSFEPKGSHLPEKRRVDRVVNRLRGRIWVDREDYEIVRIEAQLVEPVKMWGGILASIRTLTFTLAQTQVEKDVWMPGRVEMRIQGRVFIKSLNEHTLSESSGFKRVS